MRELRIDFGVYASRSCSQLCRSKEAARGSVVRLGRLWQDESGQDLLEYVLLVTLIALATIAAVQTFGQAAEALFKNSATNVSQS